MKAMTTTRRSDRISLPLPILVENRKGSKFSWSEYTRLNAVTTFGAGFNIQHQICVGQIVHLTTAFPAKLRCYDFWEDQYKVWALVRHCHSLEGKESAQPIYNVGVAFLGKSPPLNYFQNSGQIYAIHKFDNHGLCIVRESQLNSPPSEFSRPNQKHPRYDIPFEVIIETLDGQQNAICQEFSVTENISLGGAAVKTLSKIEVGSLVRIKCLGKDLSITARVCNHRLGADGIPRLHLEFIDRLFPLDGIE